MNIDCESWLVNIHYLCISFVCIYKDCTKVAYWRIILENNSKSSTRLQFKAYLGRRLCRKLSRSPTKVYKKLRAINDQDMSKITSLNEYPLYIYPCQEIDITRFCKQCLPLKRERVRNPIKTLPADVVGHCDLELMPEARQILPEGLTSGRQCTAGGRQGCTVTLVPLLPLLTLFATYEDFLVFVVDLEVGDGEVYHRDYERRYRNCHRVHKVHVHLRKRFKHVIGWKLICLISN